MSLTLFEQLAQGKEPEPTNIPREKKPIDPNRPPMRKGGIDGHGREFRIYKDQRVFLSDFPFAKYECTVKNRINRCLLTANTLEEMKDRIDENTFLSNGKWTVVDRL